MTETTAVEERQRVQIMPVGGKVQAVVPQSVEEIWRIAKGAVIGGFAPAALVDKKPLNDAIASVATAMMAGAELGIAPMSALRSFTVISGKPALYGDGLVAVVRRSGMAKRISAGFTKGATEDESFGWCEAERADSGEVHREEFTVAMAKRAGLWATAAKVKKTRRDGSSYEADAGPWWSYPERMLQWRSTGYCLRWLFADVLGGITDDYEARSIGEFIDVTPPPQEARLRPPSPPMDDEPAETETAAGEAPEPVTLEEIDAGLADATDNDEIDAIFDSFDVPVRLPESQHQAAFDLRKQHHDRVAGAASE